MGSVRFSTGQHVAFRSAFSRGVHGEVNGLLRRLNGSWPGREVRGTRNGELGSLGPGIKDQGPRNWKEGTGNGAQSTEHGAQKVSKNLVLYRLGPIGFNPIGGGKSTIELFGFMRSAPGEVQQMQPSRRQSCPKKY